MLTIRIILSLCNIHNLESNSIDFVLAFPQFDLGVDIWMDLSIGFVIDEVAYGKSCLYVLKTNKSIYGIKKSSSNWYDKLYDDMIARDFVPSLIDPYFYLKYGMMILIYVDDCNIAGLSMKDIDSFIRSMQDGPENFILNDEGDVNMLLWIEITIYEDSSFELSQLFLIERLLSVLSLSNNEFETNPNISSTPVAKGLLH